jgi:hypothetical protein
MKHAKVYTLCSDDWVVNGRLFFQYELHVKTGLLPLTHDLLEGPALTKQRTGNRYVLDVVKRWGGGEGRHARLDLTNLRVDLFSPNLYNSVNCRVLLYPVIDTQDNVIVGYVRRSELAIINTVLRKAKQELVDLELSVCDKCVLLFTDCKKSSLLAGVCFYDPADE